MPDPKVVELQMPDDSSWAAVDVTDEISEAHEAARGAAKADAQKLYRDGRDALARLVRERYLAGDPIAEAGDGGAIDFLRGEPYELGRNAATKLAAAGGVVGAGEPQWRRARLDPSRSTNRNNPWVLIPGADPWPKAQPLPFSVEVILADPRVTILTALVPLTRPLRLEGPTGWLDVEPGQLAARVEDVATMLAELGVSDPTSEIEAGAAAGMWRLVSDWIIGPDAQQPEPTPSAPQPSGPTSGGGDTRGGWEVWSIAEPLAGEGAFDVDTSRSTAARVGSISAKKPLGERGQNVLHTSRPPGLIPGLAPPRVGLMTTAEALEAEVSDDEEVTT